MKYSTKMLIANSIPIIVFAVISLIFGFMQFQSSLYTEREGNLKSTALAALALYSSHGYGDYGRKDDGKVWRGMNFNVSEETSVVDDLKKQTNVDITFFFKDVPEMTSIFDNDGLRRVDTEALELIKENTLQSGTQLWCKSTKINGVRCQAFIIPIRQSSDNSVTGAIMASQSLEGFENTIRDYILTTMGVMLVVLAAAGVFINWCVNRFSQEFYAVTDKSKRDLLTSLLNKKSFEEETVNAIATKDPNDVSVLLIFDFDNFKHVNDHYGHQIGDEVLKAFANILVRTFRAKDIIGRIGGDEFMVFMPGMTKETLRRSEEISQEILKALDDLEVGPASHFSCSIGIGTDASGYQFAQLYMLADEALYESKERGKACYVRFAAEDFKELLATKTERHG